MQLAGVSRPQRVLYMYERLIKGEGISKQEEAHRFEKDERTILRDFEEINAYLANIQPGTELVYHLETGRYYLSRDQIHWLTKEQVLVLAKIVLESRAFPKSEMEELLNKLLLLCDPKHCKSVKEAIENEKYHYVPVRHKKTLFGRIWTFNQAIQEKRLVKIVYKKVSAEQPVERLIEPLAILFSEYYFYLIANIRGKDYSSPAVYRLDRIQSYKITPDRFRVPYANRFEEGEFRKQVQFMQTGELMTLRFIYRGVALEAVQDRLPTAKIIGEEDDGVLIEAQVFGRGVLMWLLSQMDSVEVVYPADFRQVVAETIDLMAARYRSK